MKTCNHKHSSSSDIEALLKKSALSATSNRRHILQFLDSVHMPISIQEVQKSLKKKMHVVTVYRVIELFVSKGLVRRIDYHKDEKLYEFVRDDDHHHLVCTVCKKVSDFEGCLSGEMIKTALRQNKDFARVDSHSFELFGVCKKCYTSHI